MFCHAEEHSLLVFPEGTRSIKRGVEGIQAFKKGAFHVAVDNQLPVLPVVVSRFVKLMHIPIETVFSTFRPTFIKRIFLQSYCIEKSLALQTLFGKKIVLKFLDTKIDPDLDLDGLRIHNSFRPKYMKKRIFL